MYDCSHTFWSWHWVFCRRIQIPKRHKFEVMMGQRCFGFVRSKVAFSVVDFCALCEAGCWVQPTLSYFAECGASLVWSVEILLCTLCSLPTMEFELAVTVQNSIAQRRYNLLNVDMAMMLAKPQAVLDDSDFPKNTMLPRKKVGVLLLRQP